MKCYIKYNGKKELCPKCNNDLWRLSKNRNVFTNKEKTKGFHHSLKICDNCNFRIEFNKIIWTLKSD